VSENLKSTEKYRCQALTSIRWSAIIKNIKHPTFDV